MRVSSAMVVGAICFAAPPAFAADKCDWDERPVFWNDVDSVPTNFNGFVVTRGEKSRFKVLAKTVPMGNRDFTLQEVEADDPDSAPLYLLKATEGWARRTEFELVYTEPAEGDVGGHKESRHISVRKAIKPNRTPLAPTITVEPVVSDDGESYVDAVDVAVDVGEPWFGSVAYRFEVNGKPWSSKTVCSRPLRGRLEAREGRERILARCGLETFGADPGEGTVTATVWVPGTNYRVTTDPKPFTLECPPDVADGFDAEGGGASRSSSIPTVVKIFGFFAGGGILITLLGLVGLRVMMRRRRGG